ncbi:hypothetical protein AAZX31_12G159900 [Glycine max]
MHDPEIKYCVSRGNSWSQAIGICPPLRIITCS